MAGGAEAERDHQTDGEAPGLQREVDQPSTRPMEKNDGSDGSELKSSSLNQGGILRALEVVERDSMAIAESFSSLFASLRLALSEVTSSSVDHMRCFGDASGRVQESALDAATKGNRLNEEMKGIENLATQLKFLRRNVDALDVAVNKLVRHP